MRIVVVFLMIVMVLASSPRCEYCVVTEVSVVDEYTDLVTVQGNDGHEYQFYSDAGDYASADYAKVGFDALDRIISAE